MDNFSMFRSSFDDCLSNLSKTLKRCREKHMTLNSKKFYFKKGILLVHVICGDGIGVDKVKTTSIVNLSPPTCVKDKIFS